MSLLDRMRTRPHALFGLLLVLAAAGIYSLVRLPASIFPSVTFPIVKVIADAGEEPAARMMPTVTRPLEEAIRRVPGVTVVRSITSRGSSEMSAEFAWGTDMQVALERVQAEAQRLKPDLPPDTHIDVEWMNTAIFPILGYALTSDTASQAELRTLAEYTIKPALLGIEGVSEAQVQGGRQREFQIRLEPRALQARGLSAADVIDAVRADNEVLSAGLTEQNHELYLALATGRVHDLAALSNISIPIKEGPPATLADLGELSVENEVSYIRTTANGKPAVLVNVIRQPSANTVSIAQAVRQLFKDQPNLLPKGTQWTTFYDQARFVSSSVSGTEDAVLIGVILAACVLFVFLRRWRGTLVAALAIPITVAIVGLFLGAAGQTVNLMTLAGLAAALGLIADDAIVVVEDIERRRDEGEPNPAGVSIRKLLPALIGSSVSTVIIFLPFALLPGITGAFFKPLALTMALALTVSFFVAAAAVPAAVVALEKLGGRRRARTTAAAEAADTGTRRAYMRVAGLFVDHGSLAVIGLAALILAGWLLYGRIGTDFLPAMDEGSIILDYFTPPGTSLTDTNAMLDEAEKVIMSMPDVESYSRRTGTQLGFFITEPNTGDYVINLKPRGRRRPVDDVIDDLRDRIAQVEPALDTDFGQLIEDNLGDLTGGEPQPIDIKIFGSDDALLEQKAKQIAQIVSDTRGVDDTFDGITIAGPALNIRVDPEAAARYGLTTDDVQAQVEPAIVGTVVDQIRVGDKMYDLRVLEPHDGPAGDIRIRAGSALLPLHDVATISTGAPETEIDRENLNTYIGVTARLSGRDLGSTIAEIRNRIQREVQLGPGMFVRFGGQYQQQQQSFRNLLYVLVAALVLVSLVVLFAFEDWRAPIVTSLCAIAVLPGALGLLWLTGESLNVSSYVGAIMMVGMVAENAMFVINEARLGLREGLSARASWRRAAQRRLRPVAMTIFATGFALLPLALALGAGSQLMQPLAVAVIGGFVLSGPIVLFLLPGLYRWLDPRGRLGGVAES
ncbi:MAG TPA: efflux RND transporter permease subunit [Gammaproteobacteria bacterium]|nr:efflux RND transporter permease subunit [Gammaproteobacteria bacterium]